MSGIQILNDELNNETKADVAKIVVLGVGGGGCNAVNRMISSNPDYIDFIAVNTDSTSLNGSLAKRKIEIGAKLTKGLGAGGRPEVGQHAAEETAPELSECLEDVNMVFITAGMGGGTGTGAAPVIAKLAKEKGILTVAVVTKPFKFEGPKRMSYALNGIENLRQNVDTLIVIPNQKLIETADKNTTMKQAYQLADNVLQQGVTGISDLVTKPGEINLDFADVCTVMRDQGLAHFGIGRAASIEDAAKQAISSPLLETSIEGARSVIVNFTSGPDLNLLEASAAAELISDALDPNAEFIFGTAINNDLDGDVIVTVIATGLTDGKDVATPSVRKPHAEPHSTYIKEEIEVPDDVEASAPVQSEPVAEQPSAPIFEQQSAPVIKMTPNKETTPFTPGLTQVFTPVNDEDDKAPELDIPKFIRKR